MNIQSTVPRRELLFGRLIMIYQMPKVGSQTIQATLRHYTFPHPILRFHSLSSQIVRTLKQGVAAPEPGAAWKRNAQKQIQSVQSIRGCIRIRKFLRLCGFGIPKIEIITGVRELIGLVLAATFENFLYFAPSFECMTVEKCREVLLHPKTFKNLREWFDIELKDFIGIDVYKTSFPKEGYASYENRFARVLVYRFENFESVPDALSAFLRWDIPDLVNSNLGTSKVYGAQYAFVKERLRLPADFVSDLYHCKPMRHFYTAEELQQGHLRWAEEKVACSG
jgi:hypothetical protein